MKAEKINFIFLIAFFIWNISYTVAFWSDDVDGKGFFVIFGFIMTFFNVLAYKSNRCHFYVIGATGFLTLFVSHFANLLFLLKGIFFHANHNNIPCLPHVIIASSLALFGLLSTLYCFQEKCNKVIDHHISSLPQKWSRILLYFCVKDFVHCIILFSVEFSICLVIHTILTYYYSNEFDIRDYLGLLFLAIPMFTALTIYYKSRKFCIGTIFAWGIFIVVTYGFFFYVVYQTYREGFIRRNLSYFPFFFSTISICSFLGILTTLHLYQKYSPQNQAAESENSPLLTYWTYSYL